MHLSNEKKELFNILLKNNLSLHSLSRSQERLWFLQMLEPKCSFYNNFAVFYLDGQLNCDHLVEAVGLIVSQSVLLRSKIVIINGKAYGYEDKEFKPIIDVINCTGSTIIDLEDRLNSDLCEVIDLEETGLYRIKVYQYSNGSYLVFNFHHLIMDGWSLGLFFKALSTYYTALDNNIKAEDIQPHLSDNYNDFVIEERNSNSRKKLHYWKEKLKDYTALEFPVDKVRSKKNFYRGKKRFIKLESEIHKQFTQYCRQNQITVFSGLLTVFYILLLKYTKQKDILIGTAYANRTSIDYENTIGLFLNSIPLRININNMEIDFIACAKIIQKTVIEAQQNQVPLGDIIQELPVDRDLSKNILFQIWFIYQNMKFELPEFNHNEVTYKEEYYNNTSRFDLEMHIWEKDQQFIIYLFYNSDLYYDETIDLLLYHYRKLFLELFSKPQAGIFSFRLPTVNVDNILKPKISSMYKKFDLIGGLEATAASSPDKIALVYKNQNISYKCLFEVVCYYANIIRAHKLEKSYIIGVYMDRSVEMIAMLFAILKVGCAYLPIEPTTPLERIHSILDDANIEYLYYDVKNKESVIKALKDRKDIRCINVKENVLHEKRYTIDGDKNNLAYIIYTSGSTGKPKGVMVTKDNLRNFSLTMKRIVPDNGIWLTIANYSFDISIIELIWTLNNGYKVVLSYTHALQFLSAEKINNLIKKYHISHIQAVPSLAKFIFNKQADPKDFSTINYVMLGGEASNTSILQSIKMLTHAKILNMYGPTETTIYSTYNYVTSEYEASLIGHPFDNTPLLILDENERSVPQNIIGELYIGGAGVSKGYLNNKELTKERYRIINGERYYKSGDLFKINSRNQLIISGRNDKQIKLRGFRIELEEIETIILQQPYVNECQVLLCGDVDYKKELVAFIAMKNANSEHSYQEEINDILTKCLPFYMIPSQYVFFERLPKNNNGKIDLKVLISVFKQEKEKLLSKEVQVIDVTDNKKRERKRLPHVDEWLFKEKYVVKDALLQRGQPKEHYRNVLIFVDIPTKYTNDFIKRIGKFCDNLIVIRNSTMFRVISEHEYGINQHNEEDYEELFKKLDSRQVDIIVNLWGIYEKRDFNPVLYNNRVVDYFKFYKSIGNRFSHKVKMGILVTNGVNIHGNNKENIYNAYIQISCNSFGLEYPSMQCTYMDVDMEELNDNELIFSQVLNQFLQKMDHEIIIRRGQLYEPQYKNVLMEKNSQKAFEIKEGGGYIIFGGLGGIGLEMAMYLSKQQRVQLVLVSRSLFPSREEWDFITKENQYDKKNIINKINIIKEIEASGSSVITKQIDITCLESVLRLKDDLHKRGIKPFGIIHSAGYGNTGFIATNNQKRIIEAISPKTVGMYNIHHVFGNDHLDFLVVNSSLAAYLGGTATLDYAISNRSLDTFIKNYRSHYKNAISINWDLWKDTGMARNSNSNIPSQYYEQYQKHLDTGISNQEAKKLLDIIFSLGEETINQVDHLLVSFYPFQQRYKRRFEDPAINPMKMDNDERTKKEILEKLFNNSNIMKDKLLLIWKNILDVDNIGLDDNFFDIGGNSILIIQVHDLIKRTIASSITINNLFNYPTINKLVSYLEEEKEVVEKLSKSVLEKKKNGMNRLEMRLKKRKRQ